MSASTYPLHPRWGALIGALALFGGGAVFLAWRASTNDRGLILNGVIEFGKAGATQFYGAMAVLSLGITLLSVIATLRVLGGSQIVIVEDDAVTIPGALFRKAHRIPYREITQLSVQTVSGQRFLRVDHAAGASVVVAGQVGELAFGEIVGHVQARVKPTAP